MLNEKFSQYLQSLVSIVAADSRVAVLLLLLLDVLRAALAESGRRSRGGGCDEERQAGRDRVRASAESIYANSISGGQMKLRSS